MSNSGINFKVYCVNGEDSEVKRFFVDTGAVTSFVFMKEKLKSVFPNLRQNEFKITWKDADGDFISITNDEDFITALTEMTENPKVLYVNTESKNLSEEPSYLQSRVICDVCQKPITGYRYKCIECPDYDLCATCEGNGNHSDHMVLRFPTCNSRFIKFDRKMMHNAAKALKKSAFNAAKEAHRCARESFRGEKDKSSRNETAGTSEQSENPRCPFSACDVGDLINQNISPLIEMFNKEVSNLKGEQGQNANTMSDMIRSVIESFASSLNSEGTSTESTQQAQETATEQGKNKPTTPTQNTQSSHVPSAPASTNLNQNSQDMEWTLVSDEENSPHVSVNLQTPRTQPPPPPQDPRLMRGLAQLYEMGFSNDNNFLNYMLESHNYNVSDVVKAILELK